MKVKEVGINQKNQACQDNISGPGRIPKGEIGAGRGLFFDVTYVRSFEELFLEGVANESF